MRQVRKLRHEKGWTQTELAFYSGLAPSVISEIENGRRDPTAGTLRKLAKALEVDIPDLFERTDPLKGQPPLFPANEEEQLTAALNGLMQFQEDVHAHPEQYDPVEVADSLVRLAAESMQKATRERSAS